MYSVCNGSEGERGKKRERERKKRERSRQRESRREMAEIMIQ